MATRAGQGGARHGGSAWRVRRGADGPRAPPAPSATCPAPCCTGSASPFMPPGALHGSPMARHRGQCPRGDAGERALKEKRESPREKRPPVFFNMTFQGCLEKGRTETVGRYGSLTHKPRLHPAGAAQSLGPHPCPLPLNSHALPHGRASCPGPEAPSPQLSRVHGRGRREVHGSSRTPISFLALTFKSSVLNDLLEKLFI